MKLSLDEGQGQVTKKIPHSGALRRYKYKIYENAVKRYLGFNVAWWRRRYPAAHIAVTQKARQL